MKKIIVFVFVLFLLAAFFTKPDDKTCIIGGVKAVWGTMTPNPESTPDLFEQFMNLNSRHVQVKDWVFLKEVKYVANSETKTVALGAFKNVFPRVKPLEYKPYIPKMPQQQR